MARYDDVLQVPVSKEVRAEIERQAGDQSIAAFIRKELLGPFMNQTEPAPEFQCIEELREWMLLRGYTQVDRILSLVAANYQLFEGSKE